MVCIYHSKDLDGWSSAAIVNNKFMGVELVGYDYGDPFPEIRKDVPLVVVDVSFPMEHMLKMAEDRGLDLMWIDHHIKSMMEYAAFMKERDNTFCITCIKDGLASCELTWGAFHPDEPMPKAIRLLGMYDVGRKESPEEWENEVLPFQFGMRAICSSPEEFPALLLKDNEDSIAFIERVINDGKAILQYMRKTDSVIMERKAFAAEFLGHRALCLNAASFSFLSFASIWDSTKYDIAVGFNFNGKQWVGSIYSDKENINCNEIAGRLGGGGHKRASGFSVDDIFEVLANDDWGGVDDLIGDPDNFVWPKEEFDKLFADAGGSNLIKRNKDQQRIEALKAAVQDPNLSMNEEGYRKFVERNSGKQNGLRSEDLDMDE